MGGVHQAFRGGPGDLERRPHGELQVRLQAVRFQAGEEQKADFVGRQQRRRGDQQRQPAAKSHEAVAHGPGDGRHQRLVAKALHRGADLRLADVQRPAAPRPAVGKVRRQNEEHLHQRHGEHGDHHHRHDAQNLAEGAGDEQQRREGRHRRQHADGHRRAHAQAAGDGAVDAAQPALLLCDDVLADHHRVVDDDAEHDNQGEQRHHVEVDVEEVEEQERAQERNRHAHRHPHGEPQVQHHHQEQKHQREAEDAVAQQQAEAALQHFGAVFPDFHVDAGQRLVVREHRLDLRGDGQQVLGLGLLHAHEDAAAVVVGVDQIDIDEPVAHGGDVAQAQDGAVLPSAHHDVLELLAAHALGVGAQQQVASLGAQFAGRKIEGREAHRVGDLGDGEVVAAQRFLAHFDGDFVVARPEKRHQGHRGQRQQRLFQRFGAAQQFRFRELGGDHQRHHVFQAFGTDHLGLLRVQRREVRQAIHRRFHVVAHPLVVDEVLEFDGDAAHVLGGARPHPLHAVDAEHRLFDAPGDAFLHFRGRGAGIRHADPDDARVDGGKHLRR